MDAEMAPAAGGSAEPAPAAAGAGAGAGAGYNYVVTAAKPSAVTHSVVGNFTAPGELNLIVAKCTRLEIYLLTPEGLQPLLDVPLYGRVAAMELIRPAGDAQDSLFLSTERYKFSVLGYDARSGELVTKAAGDAKDRIGRPSEFGQKGIVDPECRCIGLHLYDGMLKCIPITAGGQLKEAFNMRLEELEVIDMQFLHRCARPTLAVLYRDAQEKRHVKTYVLDLGQKDLVDGPWGQHNVEANASLLIPVPMGGAVVVGEASVGYHNGAEFRITKIPCTFIKAAGRVDADGSRYLLSDHLGNLQLLVLARPGEGGGVHGAFQPRLEKLGTTSAASTLTYLDNGVVFVGSAHGDSMLVRLSREASASGSYVEVLDRFTNLGPIVDFQVVDLERQGQGQVVTCSGAYRDGSLRVVRNGVGINEQAAVELPGIKGMWNLRASGADAYDSHLVLSFVGETRVLAIDEDEVLAETEIAGFDAGAQSLLCANVAFDQLLQVTARGARLVDARTGALAARWAPPAGAAVTAAAASGAQVLIATGGGGLTRLDVLSGGELAQGAHVQLDYEAACVDITPVGVGAVSPNGGAGGMEDGGAEPRARLALVGMWTDRSARVLELPTLRQLTSAELGGDTIPRSVLLAELEGAPYAMCALGDGSLVTFALDAATGALSERKSVSLGTQPITLRPFSSKGSTHVFAASDRPTVIYSSNRKVLYSNVNLSGAVSHMCPFSCGPFPDCLAMAAGGGLTVGTIDDIQKLHIRTVELGEQPRRLAHMESSRCFAVCTVNFGGGDVAVGGGGDVGMDARGGEGGGVAAATPAHHHLEEEDMEQSFVRLMDDTTFETLARFPLKPCEDGASVVTCTFEGDATEYFCVGTAFCLPTEMEPTSGRILVFAVRDRALVLAAEREVKGAVYNLSAMAGRLLAGINSKLELFRWAPREDDDAAHALVGECGHRGHILALYVATRGHYIVVGDLMKSVSLLMYRPEENAIVECARDFNANWMSAVEALDEDTFVGAENSYNLFTVRRNADAGTDEERQRLETVGEFNSGEFINRFRHGSLVMRAPDSEVAASPTLLFGTINGVIGLLANLPREAYEFAHRLQGVLQGVIQGVGGLSHAEWRSFVNERKSASARGFVDGDLIEAFLDLKRGRMEEVARLMDMGVEEVCRRVEELARLH